MGKVHFGEPNILQLKKEGYTVVDMHIHSNYSCDSSSKVSDIVKRAKKLGVGIAITDHNKIEGSTKAKKNKKGVLVIPGMELRSREDIDMLIYFYNAKDMSFFYDEYVSPYRKRDLQGSSKLTIEQIVHILQEFKCLVCIAHPYRFYLKRVYNMFVKKNRNKRLFKFFKGMEVINGKNLLRKNRKAIRKARKQEKFFIGGSDSHRIKDVGCAVTCCKGAHSVESFLDSIKKGKNVLVVGGETHFSYRIVRPFVTIKNVLSKKIRGS